MFSGVVDLTLGIVFLFLVFSLIVSGLNEGITRILASRSRQLWRALGELLDGGAENGDQRPRKNVQAQEDSPLSTKLYVSPFISQLETAIRDKRSRLSHIPSEEFSRGLIDALVPDSDDATTVDQVLAKAENLPDSSPIKQPLVTIAREAGSAIGTLRQDIGDWFDNRMEALSVVYRRRTKWFLLLVGLVVAVVLNVDAIDAAKQFYRDEALRSAVSEQAVRVATECQSQPRSEVEECTRSAISEIDGSLRLPVGWSGRSISDVDGWQVVGWIVAGVALGQGAPFWFDLLRKAGKLRR